MSEIVTEVGVVKSQKRNISYVMIEKSAKCGQCKVCDFGDKNHIVIPCLSDTECKIGDKVVIENCSNKNYVSSLVLYLMPVLLVVISAVVTDSIVDNVTIVLISALSALFVGFCAIFLIDKLIRKKYMPKIIKVLE